MSELPPELPNYCASGMSLIPMAELDRLRADNARLVGEVETIKKDRDVLEGELMACYKVVGHSTVLSEPLHCALQRHKDALVAARVALKLELNTPSSRAALTTINEVLGGDK